jgi:hypothetical protein
MITALPMGLALFLHEQLGVGTILSVADNRASWTVCIAHRRAHALSRIEEMFISCLKQTRSRRMDQVLRAARMESRN